MSTENDQSIQLKRALQAIKDLRARLETVEQTRREPIAIIGMGCRFPGGGDSPAAYWDALINQVDGIIPVPVDRWDIDTLFDADPDEPGKVTTRWGGFLPQIDQFDAPFFGISPREAAGMDPQQRMILEVMWETFENAGLPVEKLAGTRTGVFMGLHSLSNDYYLLQALNSDELGIYSGTGTSHSVASGRVAYLYDLQGPCLSVDTACSASLVAIHLAVQSLRNRECSLALAGGANVMITPHFTVVSSRMRMMAPDGHCKAFDSRADGFVRGEGSGVVALKRLADAQQDGDPILAVIRGSAINQDGHSNGLTAPNGLSQQAVIRQALENAGVKPEQVTYVEAHGTGTPLGDPIEIEALQAVYGAARPDGLPLVVGSTKTNLGHLEGAAGVAGVIKTVLALQHATIPSNLHFQQLNPHISLGGTRVEIASEKRQWPTGAGSRLAGVSSFGWSGTNAHIILEEYTQPSGSTFQPAHEQQNLPFLLPISARSPEALNALVLAYHEQLSQGETVLADLCATAANRRSHHSYRLGAVGHTTAEMVAALDAHTNGESHPRLITGLPGDDQQPGIVFVFPGQGGQWLGMGRQLLAQDPVFRQVIEECERAFTPHVQWSLLEQINAGQDKTQIEHIDVVQPVLFAIQVGLAASLRSRGVEPDAVVGHSLGEVAAAYTAGALSLDDAARVICTRSRLMRRVSGQGGMAVVGLSITETDALLADYRDRLSVAVSNSPSSTVISGDPAALEEVLAGLRARNIFCRAVNVDVAAHSPQMEGLRPELVAELEHIQPRLGGTQLYSTVTGTAVAGDSVDAAYWGRNLRQPVLFSAAIEQLSAAGQRIFIECGPHPVLLSAIGQTTQGSAPVLLPAMRREEDEQAGLQMVLAGVYCAGASLDWSKVLPEPGQFVSLPNYPWQRKRHWIQVKSSAADPLANWFYRVEWNLMEPPAAPVVDAGGWLVFCEPGENSTGERLAGHLESLGGAIVRVWAGPAFCQVTDDRFEVNPQNMEDFRLLLKTLSDRGFTPRGVAYVWGLAASVAADLTVEGLLQAQEVHLGGALHLSQALTAVQWEGGHAPRMWILTRAAQPVNGGAVGLAQAPLWGFGRVLAFEQPELWGGLIDIDDTPVEQILPDLLGENDQQIAYRQSQRYQARLVRQMNGSVQAGELKFRPDASYLVTGGLGGLGLKVANWLAKHGAKHIALMGRSRGSEEARQTVQALEATGVQVLPVQGDASREEDVRRVLAEIAATMPPLRGVIHSAGTVEDALLVRQNWPAYQRVMASKVPGAWNLHRLTQDMELDCFVLFSSATSLLGTPSQSNYAAANAFLDALAYQRRAAGLPALAINWGAWGQIGLAAQEERAGFLTRLGIETFSPDKGLAALERAFKQDSVQPDSAQVMVGAMSWNKYLSQRPSGADCAFFAGLGRSENRTAETAAVPEQQSGLLQEIESAPPTERAVRIGAHVTAVVAQVLRHDEPETLNPDQGFFQMGIDSLMAVELKNRLQKSLGRSLRTTLAFDYPSINLLSRYLLGELFPEQPVTSTAAQSTAQPEEDDLADLSRDEVKSMLDDELRGLEEDL